MSTRGCVNSPNCFCYICGEFVVKKDRRNITVFVRKVYHAYFGVRLGDINKAWAPQVTCVVCVEDLRRWAAGKKKSLRFGIPMVWREQQNHTDDCYFCSCKVTGFNKKNKKSIEYPNNIRSAIRPVPHGPDIPIPQPLQTLHTDDSDDTDTVQETDDTEFEVGTDEGPRLFTQAHLNDLVRDLGLTKDKAELLGSRLHERQMLAAGTSVTFYRKRDLIFTQYFAQNDVLVYCSDVQGLMGQFNIPYAPGDWRLFIDSSKRSLKAVLLHNGNMYASIPVGHSVHLKETYDNIKALLTTIHYEDHNWMVCGDLKVLGMILGQQSGYTKFPCFICEWDSRARDKHWEQKQWPRRLELVPGDKNIKCDSLVERDRILLPPLHIKLGMMKQFVKALPKCGNCFKYLCYKFPNLSDAKLKEGVFTGPDIRKLMLDEDFLHSMNAVEREAWTAFKCVVQNFLGNNRSPEYIDIVENMLTTFKMLGCSMSLKLHFLNSHLDFFPPNLGAVSEEQGERFHQDIKDMERRYQGTWDVRMMGDYCWMLHREHTDIPHKRKSRGHAMTTKKSTE